MKCALVVDDHPITHLGASRLLRDLGYDPVLQAMSAAEALALLRDPPAPDLIVLDISLPDAGGLDLVQPLREAAPGARVLIFSMNDQTGFAARALQVGAHGFLSKNAAPADFREAVRRLEDGAFYLSARQAVELATLRAGASADPLALLSERERRVLGLIGRGYSLQAIADDLGVSYKTAANASSSLKKKLAVDGINGLMKIALDSGV
ncbi:response regulator transcription factor [Paracoccus spongiarum]|uniref:Response regulator transcription factor n=1 Tax=Paracoccus spongiarum TaxID=3064387 RepID=A0ABT9JA51_9RHOB|nr:response regulator transcription factor [Paracoccus sp. 2205BS29-5]MDP5306699.1 response regulator transcription factor [Paracoccus sp. 2205BS29-5]